MAYATKLVYLSTEQFETLLDQGYVTVEGVTITYNENDLYVTPQEEVPAASDAVPQANGAAAAGVSTDYARADHVHPYSTYSTTISLTASWSGSGPYYQVVTLDSGTATAQSKIDLQPGAAIMAQLLEDEATALWVENDNGVLTAWAIGAAPTTAMTIQCTVTEIGT